MINKKEEYINMLLQSDNGVKVLSEKINILLEDKEFYQYGLLIPIIEKLIESGYEKTVLKHFSLILNKALKDETLEIIENVAKTSDGKHKILENIDNVLLKLDGEEILEFIDLLDDEKKDQILKKNKYTYELYENGYIRASTLGNIIKGDLTIFIEEIIKEVSEGKGLKKLEEGTYSDVIETNGYVIKLGETRDKFEIPYHPNILQPILRERVIDKSGNDVLIVEVQNVVDTKNVTKEQRDELIQKLQKSKIKCRDILHGNIGILLKSNKRKLFNGVGGIIDYSDIKEETLESGQPVIYDTDMIEKEDIVK